jgi:hypothetical protein
MRPDIFQKALLATARVACCASLLSACQKPEAKISEPIGAPNTPESQPDAPMSLDECKAHTASVFTAKTLAQNDETAACCRQVAASIDQGVDPSLTSTTWAERYGCCDLLGWNGSAACTPWGPPCPPAMGVA